jgi:hypothetical protein
MVPWNVSKTTSCKRYEQLSRGCGPFKSYGEDFSACCDDGASVLACGANGVGLVPQLCPNTYSCVTHGTFRKRDGQDGEGGMYAQCEED